MKASKTEMAIKTKMFINSSVKYAMRIIEINGREILSNFLKTPSFGTFIPNLIENSFDSSNFWNVPH